MAETTPVSWRVAEAGPGRGRAVCESLGLFGLIRPTADAQAEADRLNARERLADVAGEAVAELREIEFAASDYHRLHCCPSCGGLSPSEPSAELDPWRGSEHVGHRPGCTLAAALAKADGTVEVKVIGRVRPAGG